MAQYLKCANCGAIVKVIAPCNCENCGIQCCGTQMEEYIPTEAESKMNGRILTCKSCNAQVEEIVPCNCENCGIQCCGTQMK